MCTRRTGELLEMWVARRARRARRQSPRTLDHRREVDERRRRHAHAVASCDESAHALRSVSTELTEGHSTKLATLGKCEMNVVKFTHCTILITQRRCGFLFSHSRMQSAQHTSAKFLIDARAPRMTATSCATHADGPPAQGREVDHAGEGVTPSGEPSVRPLPRPILLCPRRGAHLSPPASCAARCL